MGKIRFELLTPGELKQELEGNGLVFLPVGSMEWHGPHMGMGMDTCNAYETSLETAKITGGVVFPPFFTGTETPRSPETLKKLGFSGEEEITGMDFPANSLKSMYWPTKLFEELMRCQIGMLCAMGFRRLVIMNGHGADEQVAILDRLAQEAKQRYGVKAAVILPLFEECGYGIGHAGLVETAIMSYLHPEAVELSELPGREVKLRNVDYGIVDNETFGKGPNEDFTVRYDPRDATEEIGKEIMETTIAKCVELIEKL